MSEVLLADLREWAESYDAVEIGADGVLYMAIHHIEQLNKRNKELEAALQWVARHDLQAIALDALRPEERISMREKKNS